MKLGRINEQTFAREVDLESEVVQTFEDGTPVAVDTLRVIPRSLPSVSLLLVALPDGEVIYAVEDQRRAWSKGLAMDLGLVSGPAVKVTERGVETYLNPEDDFEPVSVLSDRVRASEQEFKGLTASGIESLGVDPVYVTEEGRYGADAVALDGVKNLISGWVQDHSTRES